MDVLERIRYLRDARGWSNYRLAKEAKISEGSLNNLFRLNNLPTIPTLEALCAGFGITLSQFFAENAETSVTLTPEQADMLTRWTALNGKQKQAVDCVIRAFLLER